MFVYLFCWLLLVSVFIGFCLGFYLLGYFFVVVHLFIFGFDCLFDVVGFCVVVLFGFFVDFSSSFFLSLSTVIQTYTNRALIGA